MDGLKCAQGRSGRRLDGAAAITQFSKVRPRTPSRNVRGICMEAKVKRFPFLAANDGTAGEWGTHDVYQRGMGGQLGSHAFVCLLPTTQPIFGPGSDHTSPSSGCCRTMDSSRSSSTPRRWAAMSWMSTSPESRSRTARSSSRPTTPG